MGKPVVILCGGFGWRMGNETNLIPKPMVEIGGTPILMHLLKYFIAYGHNEFILCLGHKKDQIIEYFEANPLPSATVHLIDTGDGTTSKSDRLLKIEHLIKVDTFFFAYGDDLSNVNLEALLIFHARNKKTVTITAVNLRSNFGVIKINEEDSIVDFTEKPILDDIWINAGFAVFNKDIFKLLKYGELEKHVYRLLVKSNNICAFKHKGFWHGINTVKDQIYLNDLYHEGIKPWMTLENK
jgi:glucose-1-phosphate cytidylyltransferase